MILLTDEQIEDARAGIQAELSEHLGYFVLVRIVNDPSEIKFWIDPTLARYKSTFDEICARHIERVTKVNPTPIGLSNAQIQRIIDLVQTEMSSHLGYDVTVRDTSKVGEDVNLRMYGLLDRDYSEAVQERFNAVCYDKLREVAKLHGEQ